ncbi:MAG: hypothetical protein IJW06_06385 [Clostridia bacterium]|nr:hypothetical protein [Clostridia bacterium]
MGGKLYTSWKDALGVSHTDEVVAVFENGKIFAASEGFLGTTAKGTLIGEYENGIVYTIGTEIFNHGERVKAVAIIDDGKIYSISENITGGFTKSLSLGSCSSGKVYWHSHKILGTESDSFGSYNGDVEGAAAAAAIVFWHLDSGVSAYNKDLEKVDSSYKNKDSDNPDTGSVRGKSRSRNISIDGGDSGLGCVFGAVAVIFLVAISIFAIIISLFAFVPTLLIYLLVRFIMKRCQEGKSFETDEQKKKGFLIVLWVSLAIALIITISLAIESSDMIIPSIGTGIIQLIIFLSVIDTVKNEKEIKILKKFKKKKKTSKPETSSDTYTDDTIRHNTSSITEKEEIKVKTTKKASTIEKTSEDKTVVSGFDKSVDLSSLTLEEIEEISNRESEKTKHFTTADDNTPKSRLKSTVRTKATETKTTDTTIEKDNRFKPAGDL